jgi:hypothetical protein
MIHVDLPFQEEVIVDSMTASVDKLLNILCGDGVGAIASVVRFKSDDEDVVIDTDLHS